ncbi:MAG: aspartate carbamoyltransferase regulatory subunit [Candidatus Bipolaricaulota bacterium]|nr:aspartate carbamoyltransferase regulatory subunit [Candidatus Bipolaricaulota bacterium]MBS3792083.1 aspartate carbamoyltransferase regulatory subunit [Candidatus Bipolaricaulota bacterium]
MTPDKQKMKITRIENGTVIDHINPGSALKVFGILGLDEDEESSITIAIRVNSGKMSEKDLLKIEDKFLTPKESAMIALISPRATINIIRSFEVDEKHPVELPEKLTGIFDCDNPNCITNQDREPVEPQFEVAEKEELSVRCLYCDNLMDEGQVTHQLIQES